MLNGTSWRSWIATLGMLGLAVVGTEQVGYGATVTLPYVEDFSDSTIDFTLKTPVTPSGTTLTWAADSGDSNVLRASLAQTANGSATASASVSVPVGLGAGDLGATDYFLISTTVNVSSYSIVTGNNGTGIGFGLFSNVDDFTTSSPTRYLIDFDPKSQSFGIGGFDADVSSSSNAFTFSTSETYTLTVKGWYTGGALNVDFTFSDPSQAPITLSAVDTTPLTGTFFGYRVRSGASTRTNLVANFDNFSISVVPEPSAIALGLLSLVGVATIGWKRK